MVAATRHDEHAWDDYRQLDTLGIRTVRDGVRWHLIEPERGTLNWASLTPMLDAARRTGTQVIWDLMHYGLPDWVDLWDASFPQIFADFACKAAQHIGPGGCYVPINEISFHSWAGGEVGYMDPFAHGQGSALKRILCRAAILATDAIRQTDPGAIIVSAEPRIRVRADSEAPEDVARAALLDAAQFEANDILLGRSEPELGGRDDSIDVLGLNYYPHNQWRPGDPVRVVPASDQVPLSELLIESFDRYQKPLFLAETGCEDGQRAPWLTEINREIEAALISGVPVVGICLYPVLDHPGWADDRHCRNGLVCGFSTPPRPLYEPLAEIVLRGVGLDAPRSP